MGFEIDFLAVGEGEKSGDAIAIRYGGPLGYTIYVVDGGYADSGEKLVEYIRAYYGNPRRIDYVLATHADTDHCSGLRKVIESFEVGAIYMNRPWLYAAQIKHRYPRFTLEGLEQRLREDFPILVEIEEMAIARRIPIYHAFQGQQVGQFVVLAPSVERYLSLIPDFDQTPEPAELLKGTYAELFKGAAAKLVEWVGEAWGVETLSENAETSASNESSVVQMAVLDGQRILLTGDAGVDALNEAADFARLLGVQLPGVDIIQVPHHGSRRNVSPSVLNTTASGGGGGASN